MNRIVVKILFIFNALAIIASGSAQQASEISQLALFTDRDFCVSGDTVWFKISLIKGLNDESNVAHVQLKSNNDNLVSSAIVKSKNGWFDGFLNIPDSLSTGVYFVSAFLNSQRNVENLKIQSRSLFVYNRFEEKVTGLKVPCRDQVGVPENYDDKIRIETKKEIFNPREKVNVKLVFDRAVSKEISEVVVKASVLDPLAAESGGIFVTEMKTSNTLNAFQENDGFVITGNVTDNTTGMRQPGKILTLSVSDKNIFFDYCCTDDDGEFQFYLKNAKGEATIYLQVISANPERFNIQLNKNYLSQEQNICFEQRTLTKKQSNFIMAAIDGDYLNKLFSESYSVQRNSFSMPARFSEPFYGEPKNRIIPDEYIPLDNFLEISRELLPGVQYRNRRGEPFIRLLNDDRGLFFEEEPFRLINGIPVFENRLFSNLSSSDIEYIDYVLSERMYGDMIFNGVLAVYLNDKSNGLLLQQPQIQRFNTDCIQYKRSPGYQFFRNVPDNIPDIRKVFFRENVKPVESYEFEFHLSDVKGEVEISAEGVTTDYKMIKVSKIIEIK